jgi:hypothetical protein
MMMIEEKVAEYDVQGKQVANALPDQLASWR